MLHVFVHVMLWYVSCLTLSDGTKGRHHEAIFDEEKRF